jgi:hypothetical protein
MYSNLIILVDPFFFIQTSSCHNLFEHKRHFFLLFIKLPIKYQVLSGREYWQIIYLFLKFLCGSWSEAFQFCRRCMLSDSLTAVPFVLQTISSQWETNHIIHLSKCTVHCREGWCIFRVVWVDLLTQGKQYL